MVEGVWWPGSRRPAGRRDGQGHRRRTHRCRTAHGRRDPAARGRRRASCHRRPAGRTTARRRSRAADRVRRTASPWVATALRCQLEGLSPYATSERRRLLRQASRQARRAHRIARYYRNNLPHAARTCTHPCARRPSGARPAIATAQCRRGRAAGDDCRAAQVSCAARHSASRAAGSSNQRSGGATAGRRHGTDAVADGPLRRCAAHRAGHCDVADLDRGLRGSSNSHARAAAGRGLRGPHGGARSGGPLPGKQR